MSIDPGPFPERLRLLLLISAGRISAESLGNASRERWMTTLIGSSRMARLTKEQSGDSQLIGFVDHLPRSVIVRDGSGPGPPIAVGAPCTWRWGGSSDRLTLGHPRRSPRWTRLKFRPTRTQQVVPPPWAISTERSGPFRSFWGPYPLRLPTLSLISGPGQTNWHQVC